MGSLVTNGTAVIELPGGGKRTINADELDFVEVGNGEREMGVETLHIARFNLEGRENAPGVEWTVSEYPEGVLNHVTHQLLNDAQLIQDFQFDIIDVE